MKIAIIGTRGVPNYHGGFEQFAEYFSVFLAKKGYDVFVYSSHTHPYKEKIFNNVNIIHCFDPEYKIGTVGQFIYDLNCILDSRKRRFDVILQLGYTSNSIWHWLLPKKPTIVTNMDGLEWKRSKYKPSVRKFLKYAEKLAVKSSDYLIADSVGIQNYINKEYNKDSKFIAYGANLVNDYKEKVLVEYNLEKSKYCLLIARLEPENNIETIIKGFYDSKVNYKLVIIGKVNDYGKNLKNKYSDDSRIIFKGADYNQDNLNNLRNYSRYYFHGHSVGGTNPSLLEAMATNSLIIANDNEFNKSVLKNGAQYFRDSKDITNLLDTDTLYIKKSELVELNRVNIKENYSWEFINESYEKYLLHCSK